MYRFSCNLFGAFFIILWVMGMVLAKGFWSTLIAVVLPPWAWYLSVEHFMKLLGVI